MERTHQAVTNDCKGAVQSCFSITRYRSFPNGYYNRITAFFVACMTQNRHTIFKLVSMG